jgi:AcrR family transcriptional regulator
MTHRAFPGRLSRSYLLREGEKPVFRSDREEERRDALLDIAETMMADKGILQTGLQEIGARVGLAPYAVRAQYGNRDMVIEAVLDRHLDRLIDRIGDWERLTTELEPAERLRQAIQHLLGMLYAYRHGQKVHVAGVSGASPHLMRLLKLRQRHLVHYYAGLIAAAVPETQGKTELATPLAMNLMAMACWHVLWFRDRGALSREELAGLMFWMVTAGAREAIAEGIGAWPDAPGDASGEGDAA